MESELNWQFILNFWNRIQKLVPFACLLWIDQEMVKNLLKLGFHFLLTPLRRRFCLLPLFALPPEKKSFLSILKACFKQLGVSVVTISATVVHLFVISLMQTLKMYPRIIVRFSSSLKYALRVLDFLIVLQKLFILSAKNKTGISQRDTCHSGNGIYICSFQKFLLSFALLFLQPFFHLSRRIESQKKWVAQGHLLTPWLKLNWGNQGMRFYLSWKQDTL